MIVTVFNDGTKTEVPIVPETTVSDIIECCRDPGDESCDLLCLDCPDIPGKLSMSAVVECVFKKKNGTSMAVE